MLTVADRLAILETISRYNNASDRRDVAAHVAAYTSGGRIVSAMGSTGGGIEGLREALPGMFAAEGTAKRHVPSWILDQFQRTEVGWRVDEHAISIDPSYTVPSA